MSKKEIVIQLSNGLEARPVAMLVQVASQFDSEIHVISGQRTVNAKSIMGMMTLGLAAGEKIIVTAEGAGEEKAVSEIEKYLSCAEIKAERYRGILRERTGTQNASVIYERYSCGICLAKVWRTCG